MAKTYDWCYASCGPEESCGVECENDGGGTITCGEYQGGAGNDWCLEECSEVCSIDEPCGRECLQTGSVFDCDTYNGGVCANTCEQVCSPMSSTGSEQCFDSGGVQSTCADYDRHVQCNDGICAPGEVCVCSECASYCYAGDITPTLMEALPAEPTFTETGMGVVCEETILAGYPWDCPSWGVASMASPFCDDRQDTIEALTEYFNILSKLASDILDEYSCHSPSPQCDIGLAYAALADAILDEIENLNESPCFLHL